MSTTLPLALGTHADPWLVSSTTLTGLRVSQSCRESPCILRLDANVHANTLNLELGGITFDLYDHIQTPSQSFDICSDRQGVWLRLHFARKNTGWARTIVLAVEPQSVYPLARNTRRPTDRVALSDKKCFPSNKSFRYSLCC